MPASVAAKLAFGTDTNETHTNIHDKDDDDDNTLPATRHVHLPSHEHGLLYRIDDVSIEISAKFTGKVSRMAWLEKTHLGCTVPIQILHPPPHTHKQKSEKIISFCNFNKL